MDEIVKKNLIESGLLVISKIQWLYNPYRDAYIEACDKGQDITINYDNLNNMRNNLLNSDIYIPYTIKKELGLFKDEDEYHSIFEDVDKKKYPWEYFCDMYTMKRCITMKDNKYIYIIMKFVHDYPQFTGLLNIN